MSWLRIDDKMPRHPKVERLSDAAFRLHMAGLGHCAEFETDGLISDVAVVKLTTHRRKALLLTELESAGLWHRREGGWELHDYLDWNPSHAELEEKRASAKARMEKIRGPARRSGSHPVRANELANDSRTNREPADVVCARTGAPAGRASGSGLSGGMQGGPPVRDPDHAALATELARHELFAALGDPDQVAAELTMVMFRRKVRVVWAVEAIRDCRAKTATLGLRPEALLAKLVGFVGNAREPKGPQEFDPGAPNPLSAGQTTPDTRRYLTREEIAVRMAKLAPLPADNKFLPPEEDMAS